MKNGLERIDYNGEGYKPVHRFQDWMIAVLNYGDVVKKASMDKLERHLNTDEIFVLLKGEAYLIIGGTGDVPSDIKVVHMEADTIYNVQKNMWHHILMSPDAKVMLVENSDTCSENSEYMAIDEHTKKHIYTEVTAL